MVDLTGQKFNRLLVLVYAGKSANNSFQFLCRCDCGKEIVTRGCHLKNGFVKSCGCYRREASAAKGRLSIKHGQCFTPAYSSWSAMKFRCSNPNHRAYPQYGGRGIFVCDRWIVFENFLADMGERPMGRTLDRIDNNRGYEPGNCQWSTHKEQSRNRGVNHRIELNGTSLSIAEWSEKTGINYSTIKERVRRGWSASRCLGVES